MTSEVRRTCIAPTHPCRAANNKADMPFYKVNNKVMIQVFGTPNYCAAHKFSSGLVSEGKPSLSIGAWDIR